MIQQMAPTIAMVERVQRDMKMAGILTRQQAAFDAMVTTNRVPTEDELAERCLPSRPVRHGYYYRQSYCSSRQEASRCRHQMRAPLARVPGSGV
jgi:hypothetical protein